MMVKAADLRMKAVALRMKAAALAAALAVQAAALRIKAARIQHVSKLVHVLTYKLFTSGLYQAGLYTP